MAYTLNDQSDAKARQVRRPSPDSEWQTSEPKNLYFMSNDPAAKGHNPPEPVPCEYCGKLRYTEGFFFMGKIRWNPLGPQRCDCPEAVAAYEKEKAERAAKEQAEQQAAADRKMRERVAQIIGNSGMHTRFLRRTFATFQITTENQRAAMACKRYADTFREEKMPSDDRDPGRNGLFITGPKGTGKTHLAAAIANQLMQEGTGVICMTMIDLLDRIKETFAQRRQGEATEGDILTTYKEVPLLIIDDMGKEPPTEWAVSKIYAIINARYEAYLPTIVTTNYTDSELVRRLTPKDTGDATTADATIDRLREMCAAIVTTGDSWRSK
jgi:DNA replication protein DnaC